MNEGERLLTSCYRICMITTICWLNLFVSGCAKQEIVFTEIKRIDEQIQEQELQNILSIIQQLPQGQLPEFPPLFSPLPIWDSNRTLAIEALVDEENLEIQRTWDEQRVAALFVDLKVLHRILERMQMTPEQFVGYIHVLEVAIVRTNNDDDEELLEIIRVGQDKIGKLHHDNRTFSTLSEEEQFVIQQQAGWITRIDRAEKLLQVPKENVALVNRHQEVLHKLFPKLFHYKPLAEIVDLVETFGLPFVEQPASGYDTNMIWTVEIAKPQVGIVTPKRMAVKSINAH
jgi:hypothetical protein